MHTWERKGSQEWHTTSWSWKNIGSCKISKKASNNTYVLEFPKFMDISLIFNVFDLHKYEEGSMSDGN